jgi:hypothetical protein
VRGPEFEFGLLKEPKCVICGGGGGFNGPEFDEDEVRNEDPALPEVDDEVVMGVLILLIGPDFLIFEESTLMSNIFPSSPDFFISPPVYGIAVDVIVGAFSLYCSGAPDT